MYVHVFMPSTVLKASKDSQQIVFGELEIRGVLMYMDVCNCIFPHVYMYSEVYKLTCSFIQQLTTQW